MSESGVARIGERTEEQHAAVRRRALPVAVGGVTCAAAGIVLAAITPITAYAPPNFLAMNLSFCAMLIGAGIFFYAKPTPGTRGALMLSMVAVLLGMAGTIVYARQAVSSRTLREKLELTNVADIANAAAGYAKEHGGAYPADILILLEEKRITPATLQSPWGNSDKFFNDFDAAVKAAKTRDILLQSVETASDYLYVGGDLDSMPAETGKDIVVVWSKNPIMRSSSAEAFADGSARFSWMEQIPGIITACNEARAKLGLRQTELPEIIKKLLDENSAKK